MIWDFSEVINPNKPLDVTVSQLSQLHMSVNDLTFILADFTNFTNISHFHRLLRTNCVIENRLLSNMVPNLVITIAYGKLHTTVSVNYNI